MCAHLCITAASLIQPADANEGVTSIPLNYHCRGGGGSDTTCCTTARLKGPTGWLDWHCDCNIWSRGNTHMHTHMHMHTKGFLTDISALALPLSPCCFPLSFHECTHVTRVHMSRVIHECTLSFHECTHVHHYLIPTVVSRVYTCPPLLKPTCPVLPRLPLSPRPWASKIFNSPKRRLHCLLLTPTPGRSVTMGLDRSGGRSRSLSLHHSSKSHLEVAKLRHGKVSKALNSLRGSSCRLREAATCGRAIQLGENTMQGSRTLRRDNSNGLSSSEGRNRVRSSHSSSSSSSTGRPKHTLQSSSYTSCSRRSSNLDPITLRVAKVALGCCTPHRSITCKCSRNCWAAPNHWLRSIRCACCSVVCAKRSVLLGGCLHKVLLLARNQALRCRHLAHCLCLLPGISHTYDVAHCLFVAAPKDVVNNQLS